MSQKSRDKVSEAFNPDELIRQLHEMGMVGHDPRGGRTRLALTDADRAGRDLLVTWMRELGMGVTVDGVGNILGVMPGEHEGPVLMMGSHLDTVAHAGAYDGVYGVLGGLAVARAFWKAGVKPKHPLVVAAFTNEEGVRYQPDMLGSLVYVGAMPLERALDIKGIDGTRFGDELARIGYAGPIRPGGIQPCAYLELHVEQGPVLDAEGLQIGIVEGVQGISWQEITVLGAANHAGTTPTRMRADAGCAAGRIMARLRGMAEESGTTLATVGSVRFEPNLVNVIPSRAVFTVDLRDPNEGNLCEAEEILAAYCDAVAVLDNVEISSRKLARFQPVPFDPGMIDKVEAAAGRLGCSCRRMVSGAGHDAQMMARICPVGMIFVPSKQGLSHCPQESTDKEDLARGARVLLETVFACLQ